MRTLNYKHLRYFWMVAKTGSIARACVHLHLTPHAVSGQLREFETSLGVTLLRRVGRGLELTEIGQEVLAYAERIFLLGDELMDRLSNASTQQMLSFRVGIADSVAKSVAYRLVEPGLRSSSAVRLVCREGRLASLLGELALHRLDMVVADQALPGHLNVRGYSHFLGESDLTVFATTPLIGRFPGSFPSLLHQAPFLMPGEDTALRTQLLQWFDSEGIRPQIIGEFDDSALMKAFGQAGAGFFVAPTAIAEDVTHQFSVQAVGRVQSVKEQLYAITTERRLTHPAIVAVREAAQREIFADQPGT
ncbi:MAG: transcriptional activator NhaR [Burkholderiales bacterium]|jgi:LysR family transcriptional activator of nhaA